MARSSFLWIATFGMAAALSPVACFGFGAGTMDSPPTADASAPPTPDIPFEAVPPKVYVARAKNVLVGLAPTDDEVRAVTDDKAALAGLIGGWMATPQYRDKMLAFFATAFQQTQLDPLSIRAMIRQEGDAGVNATLAPLLLDNMRESFARTVWQLVSEGRPFSDAITTERVMLTPPLAALYAFLDNDHVDDDGKTIDRVVQQNPAFEFTVTSEGPIAIGETLDPASPNYMHWYNPDVGSNGRTIGCRAQPLVYKSADALYHLLFGSLGSITLDGVKCPLFPGSSNAGQFAASEFEDWRMVTVRKPRGGEATTPFYDLSTLRTTNELVLRTPHIGFFGTPAFFANWGTNKSNLGRVTMNQTLIVALGHSFDGAHSITPVSEAGLDGEHAAPGTVCFGCHQTLDPMREFFRQAYTLNYHDQTDPAQSSIQGVFAFDGVTVQGHGLSDLAFQLASHPRFAEAWTQKLCTYANAAPCAVDDPEFMRIEDAFKTSGFSWSVLVRELFSSPITTNASKTMTASQVGVTVPIARRDHFCAALSNRLGVPNACGLAGGAPLTASQSAAHRIATNMPSDGYSRGAEAPMLANDPNIFFRAGAENICHTMADQLVDGLEGSRYSSHAPEAAVADLVATVMALTTTDPRAEAARAILLDHFTAATKGGATATDALKSTFVLACLAPSSVALGM